MSYVVLLTPKEVQRIATWVEEHVREVHDGKLDYATVAVRNLEGSGIGSRTVVTCEACEKIQVRNVNHEDVTDYDAW